MHIGHGSKSATRRAYERSRGRARTAAHRPTLEQSPPQMPRGSRWAGRYASIRVFARPVDCGVGLGLLRSIPLGSSRRASIVSFRARRVLLLAHTSALAGAPQTAASRPNQKPTRPDASSGAVSYLTDIPRDSNGSLGCRAGTGWRHLESTTTGERSSGGAEVQGGHDHLGRA